MYNPDVEFVVFHKPSVVKNLQNLNRLSESLNLGYKLPRCYEQNTGSK